MMMVTTTRTTIVALSLASRLCRVKITDALRRIDCATASCTLYSDSKGVARSRSWLQAHHQEQRPAQIFLGARAAGNQIGIGRMFAEMIDAKTGVQRRHHVIADLMRATLRPDLLARFGISEAGLHAA